MVKTAIFFCCLCLTYTSYAQEVRIKLENCTLEPSVLTQIKGSLTFQLDFYAGIFKDKNKNSFRARVFGSKREFLKYSKSKADFNPLRTSAIAFYSPTLNEMILHTEVNNFASTFSHELSHAILHYYCKNTETWLDEGIADMLEDVIRTDSVYTFDNRRIEKVLSARKLLQEGASFQDVIDSGDFYNKTMSYRNYTLSWAVVTYLYETDTRLLFRMITASCQSPDEFISTTYPGGLSLLVPDVKSFFLNNKPSPN